MVFSNMTAMGICFFILLAIVFIFIGFDVFLQIFEWQSRIHIGRWIDRKQWQQAVEKKAMQWVKSMPTVKATANERLLLWDMIRGTYGKKEVQSWQMAGLLLGTGRKATEEVARKCNAMISDNPDTDYLLLAYALQKEGCLLKETKTKIDNFVAEYVNQKKTIPYRLDVKHLRFVDTVGMVVPYLALNGMYEAAKRQIAEYDDALLNNIFPAHAFNQEKHLPLGVHDWSRGIGWYVLGVTEVPDLEINRDRIIRLADALLPLQQEGGGFAFFVFNPKYRMESSGTALIGLLMIAAFSLTHDDCYLNSAKKIERALMSATRRDGTLDYCQSDTYGVGFYSSYFSRMPFAQGVALYFSKKLDGIIETS